MTLVVTSQVLILRRYDGTPGLLEIVEFAVGAIVGYCSLVPATRRSLSHVEALNRARLLAIGASQILAVGSAIAVGVAGAQLPLQIAWFATAAAAIPTYIAVAAVQHLGWVRLRETRRTRSGPVR